MKRPSLPEEEPLAGTPTDQGGQKGYPFEVLLPEGLPVEGVVLADQVRSLDWRARRAEYICTAPPEVEEGVLAKLGVLVR